MYGVIAHVTDGKRSLWLLPDIRSAATKSRMAVLAYIAAGRETTATAQ